MNPFSYILKLPKGTPIARFSHQDDDCIVSQLNMNASALNTADMYKDISTPPDPPYRVLA